MDPGAAKVMVFDADCPVCSGLARIAVAGGLVPESRMRPFQGFEGEMSERLAEAGIRNEMAIWDPRSDQIRTGVPGILWYMADTGARPLARFLSTAPMRALLVFLYRMFAYNRRMLSPPRPGAIRCACDPDPHAGYQLGLAALLLLFAVVAGAMTGSLLGARALRLDAATAVRCGALLPLVPFLVLGLGALRLERATRLLYLGHLAATLAAGMLPLVAAVPVASLDPGAAHPLLLSGAALLGFAIMICMQWKRTRVLRLPLGWFAAFCVLSAPAPLLLSRAGLIGS